MLDWLFIILLIFAIILVIMSIEYEGHDFWSITAIVFSIPIWFTLSFGVIELHRPWEIYNASSSAIETGIHNYTVAGDVFLSYLFTGMACIMIIFLIIRVFMVYEILDKLFPK